MRNYKYLTGFSLLITLFIISCTKMDAYRTKYMSKGAIDYTGKMDSVKIYSGKNRVEVNGIFTSDPNIIKYRVYWNGKESFMDFDVKRTSGVDTARGIVPDLPEGTISFEIRTYNSKGDSSVPVYVTGNVYGDLYQSGLLNRAIVSTSTQADGSVVINWGDVSADQGVAKMEIKFTDAGNIERDTVVNSVATDDVTVLPNFKTGTNFNFRTGYLPDSTCIDTFWVDYESH